MSDVIVILLLITLSLIAIGLLNWIEYNRPRARVPFCRRDTLIDIEQDETDATDTREFDLQLPGRKSGLVSEDCPYCGTEVLIAPDVPGKCSVCGFVIMPCTTCDDYACDYSDGGYCLRFAARKEKVDA